MMRTVDQFSRTELLFGNDAMEKLKNSRVAIFGIGGVGGFAAEALARGGVGCIDLIDDDKVSITNLNRQIFALRSTIGKYKVDVAEERLKDINPEIHIRTYKMFFTKENADEIDFSNFDYIIDAIDTVSGKIELVMRANAYNVPIISSMGAGNKIDTLKFEVSDIYKTSVCPLAKVMRTELRKRNIKNLKVVYSKEKPMEPINREDLYNEDININVEGTYKRKKQIPGSTSFVPPVVGMIVAGEVIKDLINN